MKDEKEHDNGKTQEFIHGGTVRQPDRGVVFSAAQPVVPVGNAAAAISSVFMGWLIHAQFLGERLDYQRCISCGADAHADQMEIDVYEDRLGGKVAASARLCITCWNLHQNILKHCITVRTEK